MKPGLRLLHGWRGCGAGPSGATEACAASSCCGGGGETDAEYRAALFRIGGRNRCLVEVRHGADDRKTEARPGRFAQWRANLSTKSADATPVLRSVTLEIDARENSAGLDKLELRELDQPTFVHSSYAFTYMKPHPRQERLRAPWPLVSRKPAGKCSGCRSAAPVKPPKPT